jgi:hypothetical protein
MLFEFFLHETSIKSHFSLYHYLLLIHTTLTNRIHVLKHSYLMLKTLILLKTIISYFYILKLQTYSQREMIVV